MPDISGRRLAVVGLGYVGLPLAVEFGKRRPVVGFDIDPVRVDQLRSGNDTTLEATREDLAAAKFLTFTTDPQAIRTCDTFLVSVPTPIDKYRKPDLRFLLAASETVGAVLKPGDIVIYESTVYPGATEEDCVPVLEASSGLSFNVDFFVGYSPERINPGDRAHRLPTIVKVTSGSNAATADIVDALYNEVVEAGTHRAPSIRIAEAAKVIENTQRDLNIALVNELAIIFDLMGIDTEEVLEAAGSKWNFLPFRPGLVGGHCIGVDPYYLTHKAEALGYHPEVILAGRRLNDSMGEYVGSQLIKAMIKKRVSIQDSRILIMGLAFKENCPDLRNTKVLDIISSLTTYGCAVDVYDPWVAAADAEREYNLAMVEAPSPGIYDAIVLAVAHDIFNKAGIDAVRAYGKARHVIYDIKYLFDASATDLRL